MTSFSPKIGTKLTIAFAAVVGTVLVTSALNWHHVGEADRASADALKRARILRNVDALVSIMIDKETGLRGFLYSGDVAYLEPFEAAQGRLHATEQVLRNEWTDTPEQMRRLDAFMVEADRWTNDVAKREIALMKDPATQGPPARWS